MTNRSTDDPTQTSGSVAAPAGQRQPGDPLESLHKMSRTAGMGTQEYVAVNAASVVTLLLGLASVLTLVMGPQLLFVPAAAVIVGIIALRQVRNSAGTQTGRGIALVGIVLALLFVVLIGGKEFLKARQIAAEQGAIVALIDQLGQNISQEKYDAAWGQFGPRFKERVTRENFDLTWTRNQSHPTHGKIKSMRWNQLLDVKIDPESGATTAMGVIIFELANGDSYRRGATFRKVEGQGWVIEDVEDYFPQPQMRPRSGGGMQQG